MSGREEVSAARAPDAAQVPPPFAPSGEHADCTEVLRRVFEYIDDELTPQECERIKQHLEHCGPCMSEYDRDRVMKAMVRRSCPCTNAPESLRSRIMTTITSVTVHTADGVAARVDEMSMRIDMRRDS